MKNRTPRVNSGRRPGLCLALLLVLSGAGCDGFESREEGRLGALLWQYELAHPEVVDKTQPALDGEAVYVAGGRELLAFTLADGTVRWKVPLPGAPSSQNLPFDDRALYVVVAGAMRAYDKAQGALPWETPIDDRISPFEVIAQTPGYLFLGSRGYVARFRKHDGAVDLKYRLAERKPEGIEQRTRFPFPSDDGLLYVPTGYYVENGIDGNVLAYDLETSAFRWGYSGVKREVPVPGYPGETWMLDIDFNDGVLFEDLAIFSAKTAIVALDRHTGALSWERSFVEDAFWQGIAVDGETVYVASSGSFIYAMEARTGEILWRSEDTDGSIITIVTAHEGRVFFSNYGGSIWVLDAATGETLWHGRPPEYENDRSATFLSPVGVDGEHIVNVGSKRIYCLANPR
jgi:outer membrane protein assembly factor BamB